MKKMNAIAVAALLFAASSLSLQSCSSGQENSSDSTRSGNHQTLLGAGSTFDYPLFSRQFSEYNKATGVRVNYQSIGSGGGILQLTNKTVDFGATDAPLNEEQAQKMGVPALHIPVTVGAVVISYNLPELKDTLNLSPEVLAEIFLGNIKRWNDPRIAALNSGIALPATEVVIAHRSDGSGTTNIFSSYLAAVHAGWNAKVGKGSAINWPAGLGGKGNEGVAGLIRQTPGAIGYVELAYAIQNQMNFARVQNKSGHFISPGIASVTAAANIPMPADARIDISNTDAADGYPISGLSWVLIYKEQKYNGRSREQATSLLKMIWWQVHEGQQYSAALHYAPLSPLAVSTAEAILKSASYEGQPIL